MTAKEKRQHEQAKRIAYARAKKKRNLTTTKLLHSGERAGYFNAVQTYKRLRDDNEVSEALYDYCLDVITGRQNPRGKAKKK